MLKTFRSPFGAGKISHDLFQLYDVFEWRLIIDSLSNRPLNDREGKLNSYSIIECNDKAREVHAFDKSGNLNIDKKYTFDKVFGVTSKQSEVYNQVVKPVVLEVIEGYNCTIFA